MPSLTHCARLRLAARGPFVLVVRFAVVYGLLAGLAALLPVYAQLERPLVAVANGLLHETPTETRTLSFERKDDGGTYSYELRVGELGRRVERGMHAHGFVALLFVALVLATPWLGARRLALAACGGAALVLAISALMLMSDVARWEEEARAAMNLPLGSRPYGVPIGFAAGLHQTAAGGVLPIVYWVLVAIRPAAPRA
ncbi:MAG TPA: hypothetical protein VKF60_18700 [Myxococcota bacterium]|nr:hypothetical protein [Myxococcota bacterium]